MRSRILSLGFKVFEHLKPSTISRHGEFILRTFPPQTRYNFYSNSLSLASSSRSRYLTEFKSKCYGDNDTHRNNNENCEAFAARHPNLFLLLGIRRRLSFSMNLNCPFDETCNISSDGRENLKQIKPYQTTLDPTTVIQDTNCERVYYITVCIA